MLHVEPATLESGGGDVEPGRPHLDSARSHLEDGTRLTPETSRRLCCDAAVVRIDRDRDGSVLDVGRKTRTIPPALRRALEVRDHGCRFPGCGLRFADGHHLIHWALGGETSLDNLILLCRFHHRKVHEGTWRVEFWGKERHAAFIDPRGGIHIDTERETPELPDRPVDALVQEHEEQGVEPDGWQLAADFKRAADVPWPLQARTLEALDAAHFGV
jgi:hypothetical protein